MTRLVKLYSCRYGNTYSIIVPAASRDDAADVFVQWLHERKVYTVDVTVRRTYGGETRPIILP